MEVGVFRPVRPLHGVGNASGFQVAPEHFRPQTGACPSSGPNGRVCGLPIEVVAKFGGNVGGKGLFLNFAAFVEPGGKRHGPRVEVKIGGGQVRQGTGMETRSGGGQIQVKLIGPGQSPERSLAGTCGNEQAAEFIGGHLSPCPANIDSGIQ